jgi:hypothetical protein
VPERACIFVDFDQVNERAGVSAHGFGFRPAQIQLAESQSAAENAARSAQSLVAGRRIDRQMKRSPFNRCVGAMLTAASVMMRGSGWPGTSMMKQWLIRRSVRMPPSRATTAPMSSSV